MSRSVVIAWLIKLRKYLDNIQTNFGILRWNPSSRWVLHFLKTIYGCAWFSNRILTKISLVMRIWSFGMLPLYRLVVHQVIRYLNFPVWNIHQYSIENMLDSHLVSINNQHHLLYSTSYDRMSTCYLKKTYQCLEGHYNKAKIERLADITLLLQRFLGASQWYCSNRPMNISSLDPSLRALIPCTDELFTEGHKCTRRFREIFNAKRNDPSLCK